MIYSTRPLPFQAKAVIFDMDGTLTDCPSPWRKVHEHFGVWEQAVAYHDEFFAGKIDYETWCRLDLGLWQGHPLDEIREVFNTIHASREALAVLRMVADYRLADGNSVAMMILSSGFDELARRILAEAGVSENRVDVVANHFEEIDGRLWGHARVALNDPVRGKRAHIDRFLGRHRLDALEVLAVDDRIEDQSLYLHLGAFLHVEKAADLMDVLMFFSKQ